MTQSELKKHFPKLYEQQQKLKEQFNNNSQ